MCHWTTAAASQGTQVIWSKCRAPSLWWCHLTHHYRRPPSRFVSIVWLSFNEQKTGQHGIMIDELLTLFYCTTANNQHISLISLLNEKFADLLPANVLVSFFLVLFKFFFFLRNKWHSTQISTFPRFDWLFKNCCSNRAIDKMFCSSHTVQLSSHSSVLWLTP